MVISIKWEDIDFKNRSITVNRTMQYRRKEKAFIIGEPKSRSGHRIIPMTHTAYDILMNKKRESEQRKKLSLLYNDFVFLNRNGIPNRNSIYDVAINKISKKAGIEHFSMHTLRHPYVKYTTKNNCDNLMKIFVYTEPIRRMCAKGTQFQSCCRGKRKPALSASLQENLLACRRRSVRRLFSFAADFPRIPHAPILLAPQPPI